MENIRLRHSNMIYLRIAVLGHEKYEIPWGIRFENELY